jgi:uncharacterized protein (DUF1015 family)
LSTIRPLTAIRYSTTGGVDISTRLSPPYDVLDQADKQRLLARDDRNFVRIDLPHVPAKQAGPAEVYDAAGRQLRAWLTDGTLIRDKVPALYVYHQAYRHDGVRYVRKKFFARLRLEPFGAGSVYPHERTFGGPKEDRLRLMQATNANLSPIFGVFEDSGDTIARRLDSAAGGDPLACGTIDDVEHRLWAIRDQAVIADVATLMAGRATYIADGHHRYGTSLMYRDWLVSKGGRLPEEHPANYVLCVFCAMEDAGLLILPTHRVLPGAAVSLELLERDSALQVVRLNCGDAVAAAALVPEHGPQAVGVFSGGGFAVIRPRRADLLKSLEPEHTPAWHALALAFLHAYVLERLVKPQVCGGRDPEIHYVKSLEAAVDEARRSRGCAFILQPTTMAELRGVCSAGDLMPQKSTYFYPKLASGLVVNPLWDE